MQLTNFWQDVAIDFSRDRIYLPQDDMARFNYTLDDLRAGRSDTRWQELLAFEIARTRELFERGRGLPEEVQPKLRTQLRLTWLGGTEFFRKSKLFPMISFIVGLRSASGISCGFICAPAGLRWALASRTLRL